VTTPRLWTGYSRYGTNGRTKPGIPFEPEGEESGCAVFLKNLTVRKNRGARSRHNEIGRDIFLLESFLEINNISSLGSVSPRARAFHICSIIQYSICNHIRYVSGLDGRVGGSRDSRAAAV
jgi:hypothetical protein